MADIYLIENYFMRLIDTENIGLPFRIKLLAVLVSEILGYKGFGGGHLGIKDGGQIPY